VESIEHVELDLESVSVELELVHRRIGIEYTQIGSLDILCDQNATQGKCKTCLHLGEHKKKRE
jgi:hypothetical protein